MKGEKRLDSTGEILAESSAIDATAIASSPQRKEARVTDDSEWIITLNDGETRMDVRRALVALAVMQRALGKPEERPVLEELVEYLDGKHDKLSRSASEYFFAGSPAYQDTVTILKRAAIKSDDGRLIALRSIDEVIRDDADDRHVLATAKEARLTNQVRYFGKHGGDRDLS